MFRKVAVVASLAGALTVGVLAVPSYANSSNASCTVTQSGITYSGYNQVDYSSYTSTLWELNTAKYQFGPFNSSSTHNNQNLNFWGGSNSWTFSSQDNLI